MSSDCPNCGEPWCPCAQLQPDQNCERRAKEKARREMDEFALSVGYGERPDGWESGVRRLSGEDLAGHWKQIERERDEARAEVAQLKRPAEATESARAYARRRGALDGANAQALEGALSLTERERDEARADADYHRSRAESWQATAQTHMEQRDEARAEVERLTRERAEDDAEFVTYKDEVLRLRCALLAAEREHDEARADREAMEDRCSISEAELYRQRVRADKAEKERDEARAEVARARREGAEAMREAAALALDDDKHNGHYGLTGQGAAKAVRALPLPGDEP